jgi:hypothetical protein
MAISQPTQSARVVGATIAGIPVLDQGPFYEAGGSIDFSAAGFTSAAAGDLAVVRLPAGAIEIIGSKSRIVCPAGTATSDLDVGLAAYTKADGTTQSLNGNQFADSLDVGGGAIDTAFTLPTGLNVSVESRTGITVVASFDTANSPASGRLEIRAVYVRIPGSPYYPPTA